jgi:hypothetical protein
MDTVAKLSDKERQELFNETAQRQKNISPVIVEKDFWVCWTLDKIFSFSDMPRLIFKGGTSLSKVFHIINRFSEDIDISILRDDLGFSVDQSNSSKMSGKAIKRLLDGLHIKTTEYIADSFLPSLKKIFIKALDGQENCQLSIDTESPLTILFLYPSCIFHSNNSYVKPVVRIELGARSDHWPSIESKIVSFAAQQFPAYFEKPFSVVKTLSVERTFWEKVTILHAEYHRGADSYMPARCSRHYYDVALLIKSGVAAQALKGLDLLEAVVEHKKLFYRSARANYGSLKPGTLRLLPDEKHKKSLERDYQLMQEMIFSDAPSFEEIISLIKSFEKRVNEK